MEIKVLRLDNGGECTSNEFRDFCKDATIKAKKTIAYKPQPNGVAEEKNKSIINFVKAMIHAAQSYFYKIEVLTIF